MNTMQITTFCSIAVLLSLLVAFMIYPFARLPETVITSNAAAQPMEDIDQVIDLGDEYGSMTVIDLMGYYLDNPPAQNSSVVVQQPKRHFGGC